MAQPWVAFKKKTVESRSHAPSFFVVVQVTPPLLVARIVPASLVTQPWLASTKVTSVSGAFGLVFCFFQVTPPSAVAKMAPLPGPVPAV